jgi:hypothetical protein
VIFSLAISVKKDNTVGVYIFPLSYKMTSPQKGFAKLDADGLQYIEKKD